ncbi:MAG: hypothetical protein ACSHX6_05725 [Akkermansiaceae bacterium]
MKKYLKYALIASAAATISGLTSCVPLAAGAAGGYLLSEDGYKVQSPITRD